MSRSIKVLVWVGMVLLLMVGCALFPEEENILAPPLAVPEQIAYRTVIPVVGTIENSITGTAYFVPTLRKDYFFKYNPGRLMQMHVTVGDRVEKGDLLLEVDTSEERKQLESQAIQYASLQLSYDQFISQNQRAIQTLKDDLSKVKEASDKLDTVYSTLKTDEAMQLKQKQLDLTLEMGQKNQLFEMQNLEKTIQLEDARIQLEQGTLQSSQVTLLEKELSYLTSQRAITLEKDTHALAQLETDIRTLDDRYQILLAEAKTEANKNRIYLEEDLAAKEQAFLYEDQLKQNELRLFKQRLDALIEQVEQSVVISDLDGVITYVADLAEGDGILAYQNLVTVTDPEHLQLQYNGVMASQVALDMMAEITYGDVIYDGQVVFVPSMAPSNQYEALKNVIGFKVLNMHEDVMSGHAARFKIVLESQEDTLVLPRSVLKTTKGMDVVYVLENDLRVERYVTVGIVTSSHVEVLDGITVDDVVIID